MTFTTYTAWQYLLIDAANQFGLDKLTFEQRIEWATKMLADLETLAQDAPKKTLPLYIKAVMAIRKAQQGIPTGHMVGLDAICSGMQVMSALTGCIDGAKATGLVDTGVRPDAYTAVTTEMKSILGAAVDVSRDDAKNAVMTSFYGSKLRPKVIFGEGTPELDAFYEAAHRTAPGAWELLQDLLASWQPYALEHAWKLPDGYDARIKVMKKQESRIEVDELDHASFTYEYYVNEGTKKGLSNVANMTHSMDAYVLREMHRRCNYDRETILVAFNAIATERLNRSEQDRTTDGLSLSTEVDYYKEQYERSGLASAVILPHLNETSVQCLSDEHLQALASIGRGMLAHKPFELVTVHDEFKAHANHCNQLRWHYKEILAEIADSGVIHDLMSQVYQRSVTFQRLSSDLGSHIRNSNYALT
jgi:hypothetical protein